MENGMTHTPDQRGIKVSLRPIEAAGPLPGACGSHEALFVSEHNNEASSFAREHRILRRSEVELKTGLKRAYLYRLMSEGKFPRSIRLGVRAVGWNAAEVDQWITDRMQDRT